MPIPDIDTLWKHMLDFRYKGMLTLKNLDNGLPTESWDSMYHTSIYLIIAALRLKRTGEKSIVNLILEALDVVLEQGLNFRGFNSKGEYWRDYMRRKYYDEWHDKEVFRDTSRDQILSLNFALYYLKAKLNENTYPKIHEKVKQIAKMSVDTLLENDYDLGTTYGDCRTFEVPFALLYRSILSNSKLRPNKKSEWYFRLIPTLASLINMEKTYFSYELILTDLFLILTCFDANDGTYSKNLAEKVQGGFRKLMKSRIGDDNLFWELLYYESTGELIKKRDFLNELREIFSKFDFEKPKIQDFIWERHPVNRYKPYEEWKNYYAPWHDYLIVYEMLYDLNLINF